MDVIVSLERGDITQSSFAFTVEDDDWSRDGDQTIRTITKVSRLYDVSAVTYAAYEEATVAMRSLENWETEQNEKQLQENLEIEKENNIKEEQDLIQRNLAELRMKLNKIK